MLVALDLARGTLSWSAPTSVGDADPGGKSFGPALATASGLVFHAGTQQPVLRVHDSETGERIAVFELPAGLHAGPISYRLRPDGPQFLVVAPGGHIGIGSPLGDHVIAYKLSGPAAGAARTGAR
jgi:quinoprotein glucose dehydrogenase